MRLNLTLGCDPEVFIADIEGNLKASCGLIGGTKEAPMPLSMLGDGYAVQEDNVAVEFNIPPAASAEQFKESVMKTLTFLTHSIDSMYGFRLVDLSAASFPKDQLVHPAARVFGCDPDYNAWTGRRNPKPRANDETLRSCGGHVHIGGYDKEKLPTRSIIKAADLFMGVPSVLMDVNGNERRALYGKRGAYREKPFGCEYRTMSNFWIFKDRLIEWVFNNARRAVEAVEAQFVVDEYEIAIRDAIDYNSKEAAKYLVNKLDLEVVNV